MLFVSHDTSWTESIIKYVCRNKFWNVEWNYIRRSSINKYLYRNLFPGSSWPHSVPSSNFVFISDFPLFPVWDFTKRLLTVERTWSAHKRVIDCSLRTTFQSSLIITFIYPSNFIYKSLLLYLIFTIISIMIITKYWTSLSLVKYIHIDTLLLQ